MRHGRLSEDNYKFLHGEPTTVPGSWEEGDVKCGRPKCRALAKKHPATPLADQEILKKECKFCTQERASKRLVLSHSNDQRLEQPNFRNAPAIFANNDIKYDTNKQRARKYAQLEKKCITYSFAKDTPSTQALRLRPDLPAQKMQWLKRHDRECGDLYGTLPLIHGMRVALTDHIDRNPDKTIVARQNWHHPLLGSRQGRR